MPPGSPQTRFLLRSSALVIVLLAVWWFALLNPLVGLLKGSVQIFGSMVFGGPANELVKETSAGDWSVNFPLEFAIPNAPPLSGMRPVHTVGFDIMRTSVLSFTFSLPVFWAIMLAAPGLRRNLRALLAGSGAVIVVETVLVLAFVDMSAHRVAGQLAHSETEFSKWLLHLIEYLVVDVVPFIAPVLIALWLHNDFRRQILDWGEPERKTMTARAGAGPASSPAARESRQPGGRKQRRGAAAAR